MAIFFRAAYFQQFELFRTLRSKDVFLLPYRSVAHPCANSRAPASMPTLAEAE